MTSPPMRLSTVPIEPVRKRREVPLAAADAFELFTERMSEWWPLATHSLGGERAAGVRVEGRVGGRVIESTDDGTEHAWADVIAWDPPHRLALAWHPSADPVAATIVDIRFHASDGGTILELEHRAFEELGGDAGTKARAGYDPGWDGVLDLYVQALTVRSA
jgi:uncharacterized protein YndB with AHSA1/START domain